MASMPEDWNGCRGSRTERAVVPGAAEPRPAGGAGDPLPVLSDCREVIFQET
jgi:hypothetical protein